jgi:hypothetical protein
MLTRCPTASAAWTLRCASPDDSRSAEASNRVIEMVQAGLQDCGISDFEIAQDGEWVALII